ncbi:WASH complex subunit 2C isoform X4 [Balearica regulorum gibbericeps]|uniref:WASH complex subunit 2C isoform X4 n=1 Tax=Balearica regulorum gibbericeps TaxID=100784 RepID=UPI003F6424CE
MAPAGAEGAARPVVTMNGAPRDAAEPAAVWERPWSLEEIRKGSQSWSLASDAGLLHFLQEFSQQTISRTHEIKKQVDGLISETKATDCRLHNVFNDFLMLSNTQFIENRVYDDEVEEPIPKADTGDKTEQEKTREQKEADLIPKIQEAVNYGLQVLDSAFEQLDIKAGNSDSEEEESNERVELILEPKDLYIDRPLPYLIGSQQFMEQDDVGLGDLSSEEGSVDSDRGSVIDSEEKDEEESDDEFGNPSEDDQKMRIAQMSDEDDDDGCDLFDSEKEEDEDGDLDESTRPKKKRPTSFADELAARIKGEVLVKQDEEHSSLSSETKTKKTLKAKKEVRVPSDDEDDDIFKPPKLTDEDFTPFGSRGGLFSGGTGLFDDEEGDLFAEAPKGEESNEREERVPVSEGGSDVFSSAVIVEKDKKPVAQSTEKTPKQPGKVVLFDDDDDDFFVGATKKPPDSVKSAADLFDDDEEGDLFKEKPAIPPVVAGTTKETESRRETVMEKKSQLSPGEDFKPLSEKPPRKQRGLFSDEEDSEDLFSSSKTVKSKATSLPTSKSMTKAPLSLFDDDEEDLFGVIPAKKQQEKPVEEKAKQSEPLKKASSLLFSSDEEEHWNVSKPAKLPSEDDRKEDPAKPASSVSQAKAVKKTSLFEEEDEEDLFAITKESQRKPQKVSLLFEDDAVNGELLFSSPSTLLPSAATAAMEKVKPAQAPPVFNEEEKEEKEDLPHTAARTNQAEDTLWCLEEPGAVPLPRGTDVAGQQTKEKPFAATSSEPASSSDLFAASPPALQKDVKTQAKKVLSLFEEEEEERLEDDDGIKNAQEEIGVASEKRTRPKSTGVFQDEELLFSHKLQKDNDPDVDLFASPKKSMSANRILKPSSGGGLFGDDDEDDLFSTTKTDLPKIAEKKTLKGSTGPSLGSSNLLENALSAKQDEALKAGTTEKSTGPVPIKTKEPSSRIGKLQANLAINPAALLPGAMPKVSNVKSPLPVLDTPLYEPKDGFPDAGNNEELGVSFDQPMQADTLHSANKTRIKVTGKRRPPSRMARRLAAQGSEESEEVDSAKESQISLPKQMSAIVNTKEPLATEAESKENGFLSGLSLPAHGNVLSVGTKMLLPPESTDQGDDLFESEDLFASSLTSRAAAQSKLKEGMPDSVANKPIQGREKKPDLSVLGDQDSNDLFQPVQQKSSTKSSPIPFLEEEEDSLFTCQKTGKKELKSAVRQAVDPTAQDIFEDDIFATEAIKPMNKAKEKMPETNLFDDSIDIFADLTVKPKEKKTKKKVEQKSIFDDDMDDIFSSSQVKIPTPKSRSSQAASEAKSESKKLSTFDDPLNAFGGQ